MRLKSVLYKKEQDEILQKIINILDLDDENSITLHELDTNKEKQKLILDLIPTIRKYFSYACMKGVREPEKVKRPCLSIIKHITKKKYHIYNSDSRIMVNNIKIRTTKYIFSLKKILKNI
tara:strand:- start:76 stop:435 length:360 start_codon:yes stop_codon:yes gene_type:complete